MKRFTALASIFLASLMVASAGIYNDGAKIVVTSGTSVVIQGDLLNNATTGAIDNEGTIKLSGNLTNNSTGFGVFENLNSAGTLEFTGTGAQTISGTGNNLSFETVVVDAASNVTFTNIGGRVYNNLTLSGAGTNVTIGTSDLRVDGLILGTGLVCPTSGGYLSMLPTTAPLTYPITNGTNNYSTTITCGVAPSSAIKVRINKDQTHVGEALADFFDFIGENNLNATVKFHIPKTALASGNWNNSNQIRYNNGMRYIPYPADMVSVVTFATYLEVTINGINDFHGLID
jgi:hypothetical protein